MNCQGSDCGCKLTEFSLARESDKAEGEAGGLAGTLEFLAPEVVRSGQVEWKPLSCLHALSLCGGGAAGRHVGGGRHVVLPPGGRPLSLPGEVPPRPVPQLGLLQARTRCRTVLSLLSGRYSEEELGDCSREAADLVAALLSPSPAARLTASQALAHPWLQAPHPYLQLLRQLETDWMRRALAKRR